MRIGISVETSKGVSNLFVNLLGKIDDECLTYFDSKVYSFEKITSFYITVNCFNPAISTFNPSEMPNGFYTGFRYFKKEKSLECGFHMNFSEVQQAKDETVLLEIFIRGLKSIYPQLSKEKFQDFAFENFWNDLIKFTEQLTELLSKYDIYDPKPDQALETHKFVPTSFMPQDPRSNEVREKFQRFKSLPKFVKQSEGILYPGLERLELLPQMTSLINLITDDFIEVIKGSNTESSYLEKIENGLRRFDPLMLDTEERQKVCMYIEELMDIVGLQSSGGKLSTWMYGFDPTNPASASL